MSIRSTEEMRREMLIRDAIAEKLKEVSELNCEDDWRCGVEYGVNAILKVIGPAYAEVDHA